MVRIGMETVAARLATFDAAQQPVAKGRPSASKSKAANWPYLRPSPIDLAQAGFFYQPTPISPDNTTCYLCERALDGWEEDDDPIAEHVRHSSECGWAIMMTIARESSNPAEIDDPTSSAIAEARKATFCSWPHEGKRTWKCKIDKMVEAGWYFCPNEESEDFVSCAYCNLSLDGWEPKDDPFDEHYRRSPDCSFFQFAPSAAKKTTKRSTRGRKPRSSKASRTSTQSTATTMTEPMSADEEMEQSTVSQSAAKSSTKPSKRGPKPKGRGRKAKKEDPVESSSQMDIDSHNGDAELSETQHSTATTTKGRGKKRNSEEISGYENITRNEIDQSQHEPPPKRRATKTRNVGNKSTISVTDNQEQTESEDQPAQTGRKGAKPGRKRSTSKTRKAAAGTKTSAKSRLPRDSEIEARLEAQLEGGDSDAMDVDKLANASEPQDHAIDHDLQPEQPKKPQGRVKPSTAKNPPATAKSKAIPDSILILSSDPDFDMDNSIVPANAPPTKGQKAGDTASRHAPSKTGEPGLKNSNKARQQQPTQQESLIYMGANEKTDLMSGDTDPVSPPHEQEPMSTGTFESPAVPRSAPAPSKGSPVAQAEKVDDEETKDHRLHIHTDATSPAAPTQERTPSTSPQSSNAENRPPSSMKNALSATKPHATKDPQAERTPITSPSKKQSHGGGQLSTKHPWNPVDIDEILLGDTDGKENVNLSGILHAMKGDLTTPEKQMTVEEWIQSNARGAEEKLKAECEKLVSMFETEGARAMRALEGIECID